MLCLYKELNGHSNETEDEPWLHGECATSKNNLTSYLRGQENIKCATSFDIAMAPVSSVRRRCEARAGAVYVTVRGG